MIKNSLVTICLTLTSIFLFAQKSSPVQTYKLIMGTSFVQSKNYYLLTLLEENKEVRKIIEGDAVLSALAKSKLDNLTGSLKGCGADATCFTAKMKFTEKEIKDAGDRLALLYNKNNALGKLVDKDLVPSGTYILFDSLPPKQMLVKAWEQDANGINFAIGVYAEGKKANYPNSDSISFNVKQNTYGNFIYSAAYLLSQETGNSHQFFRLPLAAALHFLEMNERDNAGDYEPMAATVNKLAYDKIKTIKWDSYKYTVIVVPGAGPDDPSVALSAEGMIRCRLAAIQYASGLAPFIMVSGGKVHPYKTRYCEAEEMKKFMMQKLNIPEAAIIVDPHARHTTTNMRNCARLMFRYGIPFSKPGIVTTTRAQSVMISATLEDRCMKELKEVPFKNGARLSETEAEFYPLVQALHINPAEPMDP